jgi:hypothetical protein
MNQTFEVTVIDLWPSLKILVKQGTGVQDVGPVQYDIAASQFVPAVQNALNKAVEAIIKSRKER